jgi:hypothetical protein
MKEKKCPVCGNEIQFINVPALGIEVKCGKCGGALVVVQCGAVKNQSTRLTQKKIEGRKKEIVKRCPVCEKKIIFDSMPLPGHEVVCEEGCGAVLIIIKCGGDYFPDAVRLMRKKNSVDKVRENKKTINWLEHRINNPAGTRKAYRRG